jgi:hypothetical protein
MDKLFHLETAREAASFKPGTKNEKRSARDPLPVAALGLCAIGAMHACVP